MNNRLKQVRDYFLENNFDAILVTSHANIVYLTNFSSFSKDEREAYLFIVSQNKQFILTDGRYSEAVKRDVKDFTLIEISSKLSFEKILKKLVRKYKIKRVGVEEDNLTKQEHKKISSCLNDSNHFSIKNLRKIKAKEEIQLIEKACSLGDKTFDYILKKIKLGVSEKELAFEIEFFIKKYGADISFPPIVAFGKNSAIPHHQVTNDQLTNNQIVLLDFGVKLNNYCSDMTRTVFFGRPTPKQKHMYKTVLEAQQKTIDYLMSSDKRRASSADKAARDYIISKGYPTIPHSVGHGIGINVHENPHLSPKSKDILKEGMVFSIEPGIYIPNFGGVRIEDLVVLEKNNVRLLTHSPKQIIEL